MKKKHILFIFRSLGTGGSQKVQAFVANACVRKGYDVTIISMSSEKKSLDISKQIKIITLDYDHVSRKKKNVFKYFFERIKYLYTLRKLCKKLNPDLVCSFLIDIVRLTVVSLMFTRVKIIGSERADPNQFNIKKLKQYNKALNKCEAVVFQLEQAASYYSLKSTVISEVIPNPSINRNEDLIEKKESEELFVFGAGRLAKQKRFDVLIDAFAEVNKTHPEYHLKIYGDGEEMKYLKEKVKKLKIEDDVIFKGNVKNIFQDVNDKSIFVLTSDYEGIPNVLTESLINEIPCISTNCSPGGARLLLDDGKAGDITDVGDFKQLAKSIIKYIENPSYVKEKVSYGKTYIKKFEPEVIEAKWTSLIERVLEK